MFGSVLDDKSCSTTLVVVVAGISLMISRTISFSLGDEESDVLSFDSFFFSSALLFVDGFVSLFFSTEELS